MEPAKEVGGDFYDFYFIDKDNFMFLIADVSGKGVPAALFMMTTKTLINYIAQSGLPPKEMIETINQKICENNKHGFFITLLAGIVNVNTGKITFINCGHNPPLVKHNNGEFKYLELESNIVLGAFDSAEFTISEGMLST
jgi:sigma-B regulation protein RsbU (phosphoserine phosphatase)